MKIKNSVKFGNPTVFLTVFAVALLICVPLRFYQVCNLIDFSTGFYTKQSPVTVILYSVLIIAAVFLIGASFVSENVPKLKRSALDKNPAVGITCLLTAFGLITDWAFNMYVVLSAQDSSDNYLHQVDNFSSSMKSGAFPAKITSFFAIASALYFVCLAIGCFKKNNKTSSLKIAAIIPMFWGITKMVTLFVKQISFIRISDLILEIAVLSFLSIYLLSFGQCVSGIYADEAGWRITGVGLTAALFCLVLNIPKLYFTITEENSSHIHTEYPVNYAQIALSIFIIVLFVTCIKREKSESEVK